MDQTDLLPRSCVSFVKLYLTLILWSSCKMNKVLLSSLAIGGLAMCLPADAAVVPVDGDTVIIDSYGWNTNGVAFDMDNEGNVSGELINGVAPAGPNVAGHPITVTATYNNLPLDNDGIADDSVTFTMQVTSPGPGLLFNQGFHNNWGTLADLAVSVTSVSGTTTGGNTIVFDGFTGAAVGAGEATGNIDRSVDINGVTSTLTGGNSGSFEFLQDFQDFAPVAALSYTNSGGTSGTLVARNFDLQFSAVVPEPASALLLGAGTLLIARRRR